MNTFRKFMKQVFDINNNEKHDMIGNGIIMGCIYKIRLENNTPKPSLFAKFAIASDGDKYPSRESVKGLIQLFRMLHSSLLPLSFSGLMEDTEEDEEDDETLVVRPGSIIELVEHAASERQLLFPCLFTLANGHDDVPSFSDLRGRPSHQAAVLAPYISFDLLCRVTKPQNYVGVMVLKSNSISMGRASHYASFYYIDSHNQVVRKEKDMKIPALMTSPTKTEESPSEKAVRRAISTNSTELEKLGKKEELFAEFARFENHLSLQEASETRYQRANESSPRFSCAKHSPD